MSDFTMLIGYCIAYLCNIYIGSITETLNSWHKLIAFGSGLVFWYTITTMDNIYIQNSMINLMYYIDQTLPPKILIFIILESFASDVLH